LLKNLESLEKKAFLKEYAKSFNYDLKAIDFLQKSGNRQQATGNRQQATGNSGKN
jgi:hypothetical protein